MSGVTEPRALYSRFDAYLYRGIAALFAVGAIAAVVSASRPGATNALPRLGVGVIAAALSAVFVRIGALRVVLHPDHLEIVNPLRTHRIQWNDIDNIDTAVFYGWKVRIWGNGNARIAFGLSQFSKYFTSQGGRFDDVESEAPRWLSRGYAELREYWRSRR